MSQKIKNLNIKDLVLWTENPRDPLPQTASERQIAERAVLDELKQWELPKLAKHMGADYDLSELPTVVFHDNKPVVYDGNRRMILAKLKHGYLTTPGTEDLAIGDIPTQLPCNVCTEEVALRHILRKHGYQGAWHPLERDKFIHKYMGEPKSPFMILDESTRLISNNPHLNQRFVKEEVFSSQNLTTLGFAVENGELLSRYNKAHGRLVLTDLSEQIRLKRLNTRTSRRDPLAVLSPATQKIVEDNKAKRLLPSSFKIGPLTTVGERRTRRSKGTDIPIFGGALFLQHGDVNDLYRAIEDLYHFYSKENSRVSPGFPIIIRFSLRLLAETAAGGREKMNGFLEDNFESAKETLNKDDKTTMSAQNVTKASITQLLHIGAHTYKACASMEQTIAISIILGAILQKTCGKRGKK